MGIPHPSIYFSQLHFDNHHYFAPGFLISTKSHLILILLWKSHISQIDLYQDEVHPSCCLPFHCWCIGQSVPKSSSGWYRIRCWPCSSMGSSRTLRWLPGLLRWLPMGKPIRLRLGLVGWFQMVVELRLRFFGLVPLLINAIIFKAQQTFSNSP